MKFFTRAKLVVVLSVLLVMLGGSAWAFSGAGSGTVNDPYIITTPAQLDEVREDLSAHYRLVLCKV